MAPPREYDDLQGIDLSQLDLDHIELDEDRRPSPLWRIVFMLTLLGLGAFVLYLPTTDYYQTVGASSWVFFALSLGGTLAGVALGRTLWLLLQDWTARYAEKLARRPRRTKPRRPMSPVARFLMLVVVVAGGGGILYGIPSQTYGASREGNDMWFLVAVAAIALGILLGRWLMLQASASSGRPAWRFSLRLPPWFKWVTLSLLVVASLVALFGSKLLFGGGDSEPVQFGLGAVGFAVGIMGAIWLARRFDEAEQKLRERAERQRRPS